jgi:hypothetical protein
MNKAAKPVVTRIARAVLEVPDQIAFKTAALPTLPAGTTSSFAGKHS